MVMCPSQNKEKIKQREENEKHRAKQCKTDSCHFHVIKMHEDLGNIVGLQGLIRCVIIRLDVPGEHMLNILIKDAHRMHDEMLGDPLATFSKGMAIENVIFWQHYTSIFDEILADLKYCLKKSNAVIFFPTQANDGICNT